MEKIPLNFSQISVVNTANLMLKMPYDLNIEKQNDMFILVIDKEDVGFAIIHKVQDLLIFHGFDENYRATAFGNICESIIDVFLKYGDFS